MIPFPAVKHRASEVFHDMGLPMRSGCDDHRLAAIPQRYGKGTDHCGDRF
jgi:hypothetical protein